MNIKYPKLAIPLLSAIALSGCASMNHTQRGAALGSGLGAATGAIVGHQSGHAGGGAAIGALAGGLIGGLAGNAEDVREERDAAIASANHANQQRQFAQRAVTNADLVQMTQSGISEQVIINSIRTRGGLLDLSPQGIIAMNQQGVSDGVIQFAQQNAQQSNTVQPGGYTAAGPPTYYIAPVAPGPVIIQRRPVVVGPRVHVYGGYGPRRRYRHHHRW